MATFYQSLRTWFGGIGATGQNKGVQRTEPSISVHEGNKDYGIEGALQVSTVWACVEFIVDNLASLPYFVYERAKDANGNKVPARDTLLWKILHETPNRIHTPMEFWQFMVLNFVFRGNAYARLVRDSAGEVIEMWPLASDQVEVEVLADKSVIYKYYYDGKIAIYSSESIFHWRDKGNGVVGMSRLDYMRSSVGVAIDAQNHLRKTYNKSGKRPGVFMVDKLLNKAQRNSIRENYKDLVEGDDTQLHVLEANAKFEPLGLSPQDLQILETRRFSVEDLARWFGVSGVVINDTSKATTWGTGIGQIIEGIYKFRLRPMLVSLEQALHQRVYTPKQRISYCGEFSLEALLRGSYMERLEAGAKGVQNGLVKRSEWRQLENLPPEKDADVLTAQSNLVPLGMLGKVKPTGGSQDGNQSPTAQ